MLTMRFTNPRGIRIGIVQDGLYDTIAEAKEQLPDQYPLVRWSVLSPSFVSLMAFPKAPLVNEMTKQLLELSKHLKLETSAGFMNDTLVLEGFMKRFLNALMGWKLENLNFTQTNFPGADLADHQERIAIQVTVAADVNAKLKDSRDKAFQNGLGKHYDKLIVFFLQEAPRLPPKFRQLQGPSGFKVECWGLDYLHKFMMQEAEEKRLKAASKVLKEELKNSSWVSRAQPIANQGNGLLNAEETLASLVHQNRLVIILGDVLDPTAACSMSALADFLSQEAGIKNSDLYRAASVLEHRDGPAIFRERVKAKLVSNAGSATPIYQTLARLPISTIVSLYPDAMLEMTLNTPEVGYRSIVTDDDLVLDLGVGGKELFLLGGSALFGTGLVLTLRDHDQLIQRTRHLAQGLRDRLALRSLLFLGCDFSNSTLKRLLFWLRRHLTDKEGSFFFCGNTPQKEEKDGHVHLHLAPEELLARLVCCAADHPAAPRPAVMKNFPPGHAPYRYLDYYEAEHRGLFFGRDEECQRLASAIFGSPNRVTILCGRSGVGKTSLVKAGLIPLLEQDHGMAAIYTRCGDDPDLSMAKAAAARFGLINAQLADAGPLGLVGTLRRCSEVDQRPRIIFIDQTEEALIKLGRSLLQTLGETIAECLIDPESRDRFVFIIREDFLAQMAVLGEALPGILANSVRLDDLPREAARRAILEPAALCGIRVEEGLADAILDDLSPDTVLPAHLQIVCDRVYRECLQERVMTLAAYRGLGRAAAILRGHLDHAIGGTAPELEQAARAVLSALVTSQNTKDLLPLEEIAVRAGLDITLATRASHDLIHRCRLVREVRDKPGNFELSHESLAESVATWLTRVQAAEREAQRLLNEEVTTARRLRGHLIGPDRLKLLEVHKAALYLPEEAVKLATASLLVHGPLDEFWRSRLQQLQPTAVWEAILFRPIRAGRHFLRELLDREKLYELCPEKCPALPEDVAIGLQDWLRKADAEALCRALPLLSRIEAEGFPVVLLERLLKMPEEDVIHALGGIRANSGDFLIAALRSMLRHGRPDAMLLNIDPETMPGFPVVLTTLRSQKKTVSFAALCAELKEWVRKADARALRRALPLLTWIEAADVHSVLFEQLFGMPAEAIAHIMSCINASLGDFFTSALRSMHRAEGTNAVLSKIGTERMPGFSAILTTLQPQMETFSATARSEFDALCFELYQASRVKLCRQGKSQQCVALNDGLMEFYGHLLLLLRNGTKNQEKVEELGEELLKMLDLAAPAQVLPLARLALRWRHPKLLDAFVERMPGHLESRVAEGLIRLKWPDWGRLVTAVLRRCPAPEIRQNVISLCAGTDDERSTRFLVALMSEDKRAVTAIATSLAEEYPAGRSPPTDSVSLLAALAQGMQKYPEFLSIYSLNFRILWTKAALSQEEVRKELFQYAVVSRHPVSALDAMEKSVLKVVTNWWLQRVITLSAIDSSKRKETCEMLRALAGLSSETDDKIGRLFASDPESTASALFQAPPALLQGFVDYIQPGHSLSEMTRYALLKLNESSDLNIRALLALALAKCGDRSGFELAMSLLRQKWLPKGAGATCTEAVKAFGHHLTPEELAVSLADCPHLLPLLLMHDLSAGDTLHEVNLDILAALSKLPLDEATKLGIKIASWPSLVTMLQDSAEKGSARHRKQIQQIISHLPSS